MKILITGGNGFIAKNLYEGMSVKHNVISVNRNDLNLMDPDKVYDYLKAEHFDVVIHTATYDAAPAHSVKDPAKVLESNLRMFFNLVRARDHYGRMIYFGSGAEFSRAHWIPKMSENYFDVHVPEDQYGFSKYLMTRHSLTDEKIYNLRLFGVFGKNDDWRTRFIPNVICHAIKGVSVSLKQNRIFDHLYINDLLRIVLWFLESNPRHKVYNICSGVTYDFKTLAQKIITLSGKNLDLVVERQGFGQEYSGDNTRLLEELTGFDFTPMDQALKDLYGWYAQNSVECVSL